MESNQEKVNQGFSSIYSHYEEYNQKYNKSFWQRQKIYKHVKKFLNPSDSILEINAGSCIDAVYFAKQGNTILATDFTYGFEEYAKQKQKMKLKGQLSYKKLSFDELTSLSPQKFDYIFSNFGGLNCIEHPGEILNSINKLLNKNGKLSVVIMPKFSPGDWVKFRFRRFKKGPIKANVEGNKIDVWYHSLRQLKKSLSSHYTFLKSENVGIFLPQNESFGKNNPKFYSLILRINNLLSYVAYSGMGDYYVVTFKKK